MCSSSPHSPFSTRPFQRNWRPHQSHWLLNILNLVPYIEPWLQGNKNSPHLSETAQTYPTSIKTNRNWKDIIIILNIWNVLPQAWQWKLLGNQFRKQVFHHLRFGQWSWNSIWNMFMHSDPEHGTYCDQNHASSSDWWLEVNYIKTSLGIQKELLIDPEFFCKFIRHGAL
jgi:hypothetical protein